MAEIKNVRVSFDDKKLQEMFQNALNDKETRLEMHNLLARMCEPYVPMQSGTLSQTVNVTPDYVEYTQPYAHYQYMGEVYGPNIPIIENGIVVGWFSIPGEPKSPTGKSIQYSKEMHPLATSHWDEAMLENEGDTFKQEIVNILKRKVQ